MLVYKRVTPEWRANNVKRNRKKLEAETNSNSDTISEGKGKDEPSSSSESSGSEQVLKFDVENKIEEKTSEPSTEKDQIISARVDCTFDEPNGKHYESDNKENQHEVQPKKPFTRGGRIDYKRLNGAAHRAMSCGERDFYEEVSSPFSHSIHFHSTIML